MVSLENRTADKRIKQGRWTEEEQRLFANAVQIYGKRWKKLEQVMGTRTSTQCRSHGQKYFLKLKREQAQIKGSDSPQDESSDSLGEESSDMLQELGDDEVCLDEMDNSQLRSHLEKLIQVNMQLTREIRRLRLTHCDPAASEAFESMLRKRLCTVAPPLLPAKTTEVKVIFQAPAPLT